MDLREVRDELKKTKELLEEIKELLKEIKLQGWRQYWPHVDPDDKTPYYPRVTYNDTDSVKPIQKRSDTTAP